MSDARLGGDAATRRALDRVAGRPLNFDPAELTAHPAAWHQDERLQPLVAEEPGPPSGDGSWEVARRLMRGYEFADPSLVRAYYDPEQPLEERTMLLVIRFHLLRFRVGCRVAEVYERREKVAGRDALVWGWSYRTLQGHFEQGEMHWQAVKWPDTGEVAFRIRAWSRRARDVNPLMRLGFAMFGRREQLRFYDMTCHRMARLTQEALGTGPRADSVREVAAELTARRAPDAEPAHEELARNVELEAPRGRREPVRERGSRRSADDG